MNGQLCSPAELLGRQLARGVGGGDVAQSAVAQLVGDGLAGCLLEGLDHLKDGSTWKERFSTCILT